MELETTERIINSKRPSVDARSQTVHLYTTGGDACEYTTELLSQLTSSVFPAITSSQVSSVLSSLDAQHLQIVGERIDGEDPLKIHSSARMEKQESDKKCWYKCRECEQVCIDEVQAASHTDRCQGPVKKMKCIACDNTFKSSAVLKAHLLIDHCVSIGEHPDVIAINMALYNPFAPPQKLDGEEKQVANPGLEQFQQDNVKKKDSEEKKGVKSEKDLKKKEKKQEAAEIKGEKETGIRCGVDGCAVRLMLASNIDYHRQCHNGSNWRCCECGETMGSWPSLTLHLWKQHAVDIELYSCDHCSYKTNSLSKLVNLHRRTHGEDRPFLCNSCGKGFKNTKQLRNHKIVHRTKEKTEKEESFSCEICSRTFGCARMLRHHTDIVHRKLRPYLCSHCGHAASSKSSLRMHARQHTGEKPYSCSECEFKTSDHNTMRRHKMRHSGTKHYTCPHCPYASIQSSTFKSHLNNKHPGLDNGLLFSCEVCPYKTVKKENFLAHTSYHSLKTGEHDLAKEPDVQLHEYSLRINMGLDHQKLLED